MNKCYVEEAEEALEGERDYAIEPHLKHRAVVYLFCRDKDGKRHVIRDWRGTFRPYLWIPSRSDNKNAVTDLLGRKVKKHYTDLPREVPHIRDNKSIKFTDEADVLFENRFVIDKGIKCGIKVLTNPPFPAQIQPAEDLDIMPRKFYYDTEWASLGDIDALVRDPEYPMVLTGHFDSYTNEMHAYLFKPPMITKKECKVIIEKVKKAWLIRGYTIHVYLMNNEFQTFNGWLQQVYDDDPDQLICHNGDRFDFPVMWNRCKKKKWRIMHKLSPVGSVQLRGDYPMIKGREHLDFCGDKNKHDGMYTNFTVQDVDIPSLKLGDLAAHELGYKYKFGKIGYRTYDLWHSENPDDLYKLLYYFFEDLWVVPSIDRKKGMSDRYEIFRRIFGCSTKDGLKNSIFIDIACLRISDAPLPTKFKGKRDEKDKGTKKQIEGAIVIRPRAGIHGAMPNIGEKIK